MVTTIKVLKRKDAASVVIAVVIAMILVNLLPDLTNSLANSLSGLSESDSLSAYDGASWQVQYLQPSVWAVLQLLVLELIVWVYTFFASMFKAS